MSQLDYFIKRRVPPNPKLVQALAGQRGEFTADTLAMAAGCDRGQALRFIHKRFYRGELERVRLGSYRTPNEKRTNLCPK